MPPTSAARRPHARAQPRRGGREFPSRRISGPIARSVPAVTLPAPRHGSTGAFERLRALPDHRMVDRLLRGRAWIWLIGLMLGGIVAMQVDTRERGFSYAYDAPLDMRMDPEQELTARELVNTWERRQLSRVLRQYGEERYADRIAGEIVRRRPLETTFELVDAIPAAIPAPARFAGGHPAKRTFQAIRIAVNEELAQLDAALPLAWQILKPGGRLAAISFHSLEDRRVKRFIADRTRGCICPPDLPVCGCGRTPEAALVFRRSIAASAGEVAANPRSKSARLRAARKLKEEH